MQLVYHLHKKTTFWLKFQSFTLSRYLPLSGDAAQREFFSRHEVKWLGLCICVHKNDFKSTLHGSPTIFFHFIWKITPGKVPLTKSKELFLALCFNNVWHLPGLVYTPFLLLTSHFVRQSEAMGGTFNFFLKRPSLSVQTVPLFGKGKTAGQ